MFPLDICYLVLLLISKLFTNELLPNLIYLPFQVWQMWFSSKSSPGLSLLNSRLLFPTVSTKYFFLNLCYEILSYPGSPLTILPSQSYLMHLRSINALIPFYIQADIKSCQFTTKTTLCLPFPFQFYCPIQTLSLVIELKELSWTTEVT